MPERILVLAGLLMLLLQSCTPKDEASTDAAQERNNGHLWEEQVKTLEKARNLQNDLNESYRQRAEEIEKQSR